ncbi:MAG: hypothetical protein D6706_21640 [Chloroflexi bacterium]|nr:MAG: hypothetical protein D6706_21640 [Chloroflexota bacterium]
MKRIYYSTQPEVEQVKEIRVQLNVSIKTDRPADVAKLLRLPGVQDMLRVEIRQKFGVIVLAAKGRGEVRVESVLVEEV